MEGIDSTKDVIGYGLGDMKLSSIKSNSYEDRQPLFDAEENYFCQGVIARNFNLFPDKDIHGTEKDKLRSYL